jgi:hypothetical protein
MRDGISARHGTPGTVAERHSFLVVEESLGGQTIAEYRRSRATVRRPLWRARVLAALRRRRTS